jgi:transposase InsO family protein
MRCCKVRSRHTARRGYAGRERFLYCFNFLTQRDTRPPNVTEIALADAYVKRLIGTLRRECLDHVLIFGERHLRRILALCSSYYNQTRTHLALRKDAPLRRAVQGSGTIIATRILFGLHHRYARI